ncbi:MAG: 3'-5' exoribonuclease YhaM family protein [Candidatus Aenigmatarchaeota archaeon]
MKEQFIEDLKEGMEVDSKFSVKYKKPLREYKKGYMFVLGLADRTDEIEAKFWGGSDREKVQELLDSISPGDVVRIRGKASVFQNNLQINVEEGNLKMTEDYEIEDFVGSSKRDVEEILEEVRGKFEDLENDHLKRLMEDLLEDEDFVGRLKRTPAAMYYHHAYLGGLLKHTLDMIELAETLQERHPELDLDLLKVGCFVHDIGKIEEFKVTTNIKQSRAGLLTGHIPLGQEILSKRIEQTEGFPEDLKHKLLHIISSHHGEKENGAVKEPMFPEALAVHYLDEIDSQVVQMIDVKEDANTEDFHTWDKRFGQVYLE